MKKTVIGGAALLAAAAFIAKLIGAFYRIPLTNVIGAEGIGLYQLVFPVYSLLLTLSGSGVSVAVSRLVAEKNAKGESSSGVMRGAIKLVLPLSMFAAAILAVFSVGITKAQGSDRLYYGFLAIAPAILFASLSGLYKGWFQGNLNMLPSGLSMLVGQAVKLSAGLLLAYLLLPRGVEYAVYGALYGVVISELVTLIFILVFYLINNKKLKFLPNIENSSVDGKSLMRVALPITIGAVLLPVTQFIDTFLVVNLLKYGGLSVSAATAQYGLFSGTVMSIVNMPVVLTLALSVAILPSVSSGRIRRDLDGIVKKSSTSIKLAFVIGVPSSLLMFVLARPIIELLYPTLSATDTNTAVILLTVCAFTIVFQAEGQIYTSLLQALDKTYVPVKNLGFAIFLRVALSVLLIIKIGIVGVAVASLVMSVCAVFLNVIYLNKLLGKNVKLVENVSEILLSGVIITLIALLVSNFVRGNLTVILLAAGVSAVVYVVMLAVLKVFDKSELEGMPFAKLLSPSFGAKKK